ncbi:hypothetical protein G6F32_015145 [Rhizopus arrhizus]|nr:hypothetical protein G6F32_015145 [Rhizopus arrhizus]
MFPRQPQRTQRGGPCAVAGGGGCAWHAGRIAACRTGGRRTRGAADPACAQSARGQPGCEARTGAAAAACPLSAGGSADRRSLRAALAAGLPFGAAARWPALGVVALAVQAARPRPAAGLAGL